LSFVLHAKYSHEALKHFSRILRRFKIGGRYIKKNRTLAKYFFENVSALQLHTYARPNAARGTAR